MWSLVVRRPSIDNFSRFRLLWNRWTEKATEHNQKQVLCALHQICGVFLPIGIIRWPPWPLISWDIFDFSATVEQNLTKLDRKQDLNAIYQVCVFHADWKPRWPPWPLICWDIFDLFSVTAERILMKLDKKRVRPLPSLCLRADWKTNMAALILASNWLGHF